MNNGFIKGVGAVIGIISVMYFGYEVGYAKGRDDEKLEAYVEVQSFVTELKSQLATKLLESLKKEKLKEQTEEAKED